MHEKSEPKVEEGRQSGLYLGSLSQRESRHPKKESGH
jgi:hypothetical protein